ncbi:MAG: ATP-dependent nuclease [Planctomycetota bacterium]
MLTKLTVRNFKRFREVEVELGNPVVLIGPNNSGKTTALQGLALWEAGLRRWNEKRKGMDVPEKRPGVTINRRDLVALPVPAAILLWHGLHVREVTRVNGKPSTKNIRIDVIVEGVTADQTWACGLEFDYANEESFYCRPLRLSDGKSPERMPVPDQAGSVRVAFLPPMSGLAANETRLDPGAINVRVGEGRTAEVLRNLCYAVASEDEGKWQSVVARIEALFGCALEPPDYIPERGEIDLRYAEQGQGLDISASGRGLQQTLLLLTYMYANPGAVLLLDEPDAHLEILRQRQVYQLLTDVATENGNQIVAASHSEVLLNEAADRDVVIAFVGTPHRIDDRGSQVRKALREIGFEHYYQAEQKGWVLYLEGATDLAILRAFARKLGHAAAEEVLERPYVFYVGNQPAEARRHFHGLREACPRLVGVALFDRLDRELPDDLGARGLAWHQREIESYLCYPQTLEAYARATAEEAAPGDLFAPAEADRRVGAMRESIEEVVEALERLGRGSPWDGDLKVSDEFLVPLFRTYFKKLGLPNLMSKKDFHELANLVPEDKLDAEITEKLDAIVVTAQTAQPVEDED